jgi:predicted nuclease with TOPRIM domain
VNKKQLQERVEDLEAENADFQTEIDELEAENADFQTEIDELERENYLLEDELLELRGSVPYFPPAKLKDDPKQYIRMFHLNRHLKEIPQ